MKFKRLDRRMTGYGNFTHVADFSYGRGDHRLFVEARNWCQEQWGTSCEIDLWTEHLDLQNPAWSWERGSFNKNYRCRIFLVSEKEAQWFSLRWVV
jgi:hypothetical protein